MRLFTFISTMLFLSLGFSQDKYQGLLWEVSGNGLDEPSYLYGTMHVSNRLAYNLIDSFFVAIGDVDVVGLESDPSTWLSEMEKSGELESMRKYAAYYGGHTSGLYSSFNPTELDREMLASLLSFQHNLTNGMLYRSGQGMSEDFEEPTFLDMFIFQAGTKYNKTIVSLEDFQESRDLVEKARIARMKDNELSSYDFDFGEGNVREKFNNAYREGDLDLLDSLDFMMQPSKAYRQYMLYERNRNMVVKMDSIMRAGSSIFSGVGAAHLPGDSGMIEMLRAQGYKLRAVQKDRTSAGKKIKKKIDDTYIGLNMRTRFDEDSTFSVSLPQKLTSTPSVTSLNQYFQPEMVNGGFFHIVRVFHNGGIYKETPEELLTRIEDQSLLFENIPGDIKTQKRTTINGYPSLDITSTLKDGERTRYQIIVTPLELFIFKIKGKAKFVDGSNGKEFFNSIKFYNHTKNWTPYIPNTGGYSIDLSGDYIKDGDVVESQNEGKFYYSKEVYWHDTRFIEEDTFELNVISEEFAESANMEIDSRELVDLNGYSALNVKYVDSTRSIFAKYIIIGTKYYALITNDSVNKDKYLNSFKVVEYIYENDFELRNDTLYHFTVVSDVAPELEELGRYSNYYEIMRDLEEEEEDNSHLSESKRTNYVSPVTKERINVYFFKFHLFRGIDTVQSFFEMISERNADDDMIISRELFIDHDTVSSYEYLLSDTNSSRGIKIKHIIKDGVMFTLTTPVDTIGKESKFVSTFFETFEHSKDTIIGRDVKEDKNKLYLEYVYSGDSLKLEHAKDSYDVVEITDEYVPEYIAMLDSIEDWDMEKRVYFVKDLGWRESDSLLPFYSNYYDEKLDTVVFQIAILRGLARNRTQESYDLFEKEILKDAPLSNSKRDIEYIFGAMYDTLELTPSLIKSIFHLTQLEEYKNELFELMSRSLDSNVVEAQDYMEFKDNILLEAKFTLKRLRAADENNSSSGSFTNQARLKYLLNILFYIAPDDEEVQSLFEKALRLENKSLRYSMVKIGIPHDREIDDTIYSSLSKDLKKRTIFYDFLLENNALEKFDTAYLADTIFYQGKLVRDEEDSVEYYSTIKGFVQGDSVDVLFFKTKSKYQDKWKLSYIVIKPKAGDTMNTDYVLKETGIRIKVNKDLDEECQEFVDDLRYYGRLRHSKGSRRGGYYY